MAKICSNIVFLSLTKNINLRLSNNSCYFFLHHTKIHTAFIARQFIGWTIHSPRNENESTIFLRTTKIETENKNRHYERATNLCSALCRQTVHKLAQWKTKFKFFNANSSVQFSMNFQHQKPNVSVRIEMVHGVEFESVLFPSQQLFVRTSSFTQDFRFKFLFVFHFQIVRFDTHWYTFEFSSIKLAFACIRCDSAIFFHFNCFHIQFHSQIDWNGSVCTVFGSLHCTKSNFDHYVHFCLSLLAFILHKWWTQ